MERAALDRVAGMVRDLPALPLVAQEALALLSNPTTEPEELQAVLSRDPALALSVLRLANSAFYRRKRAISTLASAILLLGFKTIHTLILSSAVHRVLAAAGPHANLLWEHCFAAGVACRELRRRVEGHGDAAEEAFLAGLFHDIAKGVMAAKFPRVYARSIGTAGELAQLGFHHGHLGQVLLEQWEIPVALADAVGTHHDEEPSELGCLAAVADWLAWSVAPGIGTEVPPVPVQALAGLGPAADALDDLRDRLASSLAEERSGHG
ncbi:MAG: HDOD domain-containing protein [Deltaproteobacteria bacterium]|nr:HDOD domain-containing protein [Deltaproteobacteria bacterium]